MWWVLYKSINDDLEAVLWAILVLGAGLKEVRCFLYKQHMISNGTYRNLDSYQQALFKDEIWKQELKFDLQSDKMLFIFPIQSQTFQFMVS